jgi:hypothetical protein
MTDPQQPAPDTTGWEITDSGYGGDVRRITIRAAPPRPRLRLVRPDDGEQPG